MAAAVPAPWIGERACVLPITSSSGGPQRAVLVAITTVTVIIKERRTLNRSLWGLPSRGLGGVWQKFQVSDSVVCSSDLQYLSQALRAACSMLSSLRDTGH
jgi:hypothetical protein